MMIQTSCHIFRDQDFNDAVATFKLILRWCDETAAGNEARQKVNITTLTIKREIKL